MAVNKNKLLTFHIKSLHAGIYMGNGLFSHSSASKGVRISQLSEDYFAERYFAERYVTARRILSDEEYEKIAQE